jgi:hypothetical protein
MLVAIEFLNLVPHWVWLGLSASVLVLALGLVSMFAVSLVKEDIHAPQYRRTSLGSDFSA